MSSIACPHCLSFNPASAGACAQCGAALHPRVRGLWLAFGLLVIAGATGLGWWLREGLRFPRAPLKGEAASQADPADRPAPVPPEPAVPAPAAVSAEPPLLRVHYPTVVAVTPYDGSGLPLLATVACPIAKDTIALPMAAVRGAVTIEVRGSRMEAVTGYQDDVVLVNVPGLGGEVESLGEQTPPEGDEVSVFAAAGVVAPAAARVVRAARDTESGRDRLVITRADFPCGAVVQDRSGKLAGLFLGPSSDGQGIVLPPSRIAAALAQRQYLGLTQLKLFFHDQSAYSRRELGLTYVKLGYHAQAIDELVAAAALEPGYRDELRSLLVSLFRTYSAKLHDQRRDDEARDALARGLHQFPNQPELLRDQGVIQLALDDDEGAVWSFRQALSLGAEDPGDVRQLLERALLNAGRDARAKRDIAGAIRFLEDGAASFPESGLLRLELAQAYAEAGFLHDALGAYLEAGRLEPSLAGQAEAAAERLRQSLSSSGGVEIHFTPGSKAIRAVMRLNDRVSTEVIVDTGASTSVITRKVAEQLRLASDGPQVEVLTAGGRIRAPLGRLQSAAIGAAVVRDLEVVIVDLPDWDGTGGLVGLNFLDRFHTAIDFQRGVLTLTKR